MATKAYEAWLEFRREQTVLANTQPKLYEMRRKQLYAKYAWLNTIVLNRTGLQLTVLSALTEGSLFTVFEAIRGPARMNVEGAVEQLEADLAKIAYRNVDGLYRFMLSHAKCNNIVDLNEELESHGYRFATDYPSKMFEEDDVSFCERTGDPYHVDDLTEVVIRLSAQGRVAMSEMWCQSERDRRAFYCEVSELTFADAYFNAVRTYDDETACAEYMSARAGEHDYAYSERRNVWVHTDAWDPAYHDWEDDDDEVSQHMHDYHDAPKYHFQPRIRIARQSLRGFFGYELEMHFDTFEDREGFMKSVRDAGFGVDVVTFERDGSLRDDDNGTYSVEVITAPLSLAEVQDPVGMLACVLELAREHSGYTSELCGTHITSNTTRFSCQHREQLLFAFYALRDTTVYVARRERDRYASFNTAFEKYSVVNQREDDLYEFRAFAGTLDHDQAASYAEYIEAIAEWTSDPSLPVVTNHYTRFDPTVRAAFRAFVKARAPRYPHLAARFCAPAALLKETA